MEDIISSPTRTTATPVDSTARPERDDTSATARMKKDCLSFMVSLRESFLYGKASLVGLVILYYYLYKHTYINIYLYFEIKQTSIVFWYFDDWSCTIYWNEFWKTGFLLKLICVAQIIFYFYLYFRIKSWTRRKHN